MTAGTPFKMSAAASGGGDGGNGGNDGAGTAAGVTGPEADLSMIESNLELEELDYDIYRSARKLWRPKNARGIFGGAVIAQSLAAASRTVPEGYFIHSLHSYFVLRGDETRPVVYHVERVRDGKSYITRTVQARQRNKAIFTVTCSFQRREHSSLQHQAVMPKNLPDPDRMPTDEELLSEQNATKYNLSPELRQRLLSNIEIGPTESRRIPQKYLYPAGAPPVRSGKSGGGGGDGGNLLSYVRSDEEDSLGPADRKQAFWAKAKGRIQGNWHMHAMCMAYFSDSWFLSTSLRVNDRSPRDVGMMASLDHSIYFHDVECRADEWLYFEMQSPWSGAGRGFNIGRIFTRDGRLVAECIQEGLIRLKEDRPATKAAKI